MYYDVTRSVRIRDTLWRHTTEMFCCVVICGLNVSLHPWLKMRRMTQAGHGGSVAHPPREDTVLNSQSHNNKNSSTLVPEIPLPGDAHQHLIAGAQEFLDHALGEVSPKMLTRLERLLSELNVDLAVLRSLSTVT